MRVTLAELKPFERFRLKEMLPTSPGCYRIVETVGINDDNEPLTIAWPGLFTSKRSAILEIEKTYKIKFNDHEYKTICYRG